MSNLFEKDTHVKAHALNMWANHIETGDVTLSSNDAIRMKKFETLKVLTDDQKKFISRLRKLATKELNAKK